MVGGVFRKQVKIKNWFFIINQSESVKRLTQSMNQSEWHIKYVLKYKTNFFCLSIVLGPTCFHLQNYKTAVKWKN